VGAAQGDLTGSGVEVTYCGAFLEDRKISGMTGEQVCGTLEPGPVMVEGYVVGVRW